MTTKTPALRQGYRPELDGIRGVAILLVLASHANLVDAPYMSMVGVNLFFVLSGYLITGLLMQERAATGRVSVRGFYERRIRRLAPAFLVMIVVVGVVVTLQGRGAAYPAQGLAAVLYMGNIMQALGLPMGALGHTWSLALEEQFYLIWPALFLLVPRRILPFVAIAGICWAIAAQLIYWPEGGAAVFRPDVRMDAILWGCLIALIPRTLPRWFVAAGWIALAVVTVVDVKPYSLGLASVAGAVVVLGAASFRGPLSARWLVRTGQISYGLYLWHVLPVFGFGRPEPGDLLPAAAGIAAAFVLALISERWIELPFRRRRSVDLEARVPAERETNQPGMHLEYGDAAAGREIVMTLDAPRYRAEPAQR